MHHHTQSILVVVILIGIVVLLGITIGKGGLTGGTVAKTIACFNDQDCDDQIELTEDSCKNPGTEYSLCVNKPKNK